MVVDIDCNIEPIERIKAELLLVPGKDHPLVLRNGLTLHTLEQWEVFLSDSCGWTLDNRHFEPDASQPDVVKDSYSHKMNWWEISYQPELATSYAFSKTKQPLHTDNAWWSDGGDINFDAMKKQASSGGEQYFYPLLRLVDDLQNKAPELFRDLSSIPVTISKGDGKDANETTIIKQAGPIGYEIAWNYYRTERTSPEVDRLCETFFQFLIDQEETSSIFKVRCNTGDCLALADSLVLHGRMAFTAEKPFDRIFLQSAWRVPDSAQTRSDSAAHIG